MTVLATGPSVALIEEMLEGSAAAIRASIDLTDEIARVADALRRAFATGHKLLVCGNGGSACDAQHLAGELMGQFTAVRKPRPAIALSADSAVLTCIGNDFSFAEVFARQVEGLAAPGDVLIGISTSGESENILRAFAAAPAGVLKVALTGEQGRLAEAADVSLRVPGTRTAFIQAAHLGIIHALCSVLDRAFAASDAAG